MRKTGRTLQRSVPRAVFGRAHSLINVYRSVLLRPPFRQHDAYATRRRQTGAESPSGEQRRTPSSGSRVHLSWKRGALQHVGYWLTERENEGVEIITGHVRGDPQVLRPLARAGDLLILVLETGQRLPFRLTYALPDGMTWEIDALRRPR